MASSTFLRVARQSRKLWSRKYATKPTFEHTHTSSAIPPPRLDYRSIAQNVASKIENSRKRNAPISSEGISRIASLYKEHTDVSVILNTKRHERSSIGEKIQRAAKDKDQKSTLLEEAKALKEEITQFEANLSTLSEELQRLSLLVPNDTHPDTPIGPESAAKTVHEYLKRYTGDTDKAKDHVSTAKAMDLVDFEAGTVATGSSWYYLRNDAALLEIALTNFAITVAIEHGYTPVITPDVVRADIASRCGFQPRDHSDPPVTQSYHLEPLHPSPQLILSGTAEIPLAAMFANKIYPAHLLPQKVVGLGRAFRAEAGARGADTRGLYRVHQFSKVELFAVTTADKSSEMLEEMRGLQMHIFACLGIPYRVLDMPTEELGASAYRKYDIEAWMPGRGGWGEISSLSNCTDYQARRLHIRYRPETTADSSTSKTGADSSSALPFAHTLNGTAAAIPRLIVALLENGVELDDKGNVIALHLPSTLQPYWLMPLETTNSLVRWR